MDLEHLAKLGEYLEAISVWNIASVEDEPDTKLTQWRIFSVRGGAISPDGKETVHFVGYTDGWHGECKELYDMEKVVDKLKGKK